MLERLYMAVNDLVDRLQFRGVTEDDLKWMEKWLEEWLEEKLEEWKETPVADRYNILYARRTLETLRDNGIKETLLLAEQGAARAAFSKRHGFGTADSLPADLENLRLLWWLFHDDDYVAGSVEEPLTLSTRQVIRRHRAHVEYEERQAAVKREADERAWKLEKERRKKARDWEREAAVKGDGIRENLSHDSAEEARRLRRQHAATLADEAAAKRDNAQADAIAAVTRRIEQGDLDKGDLDALTAVLKALKE